MNLLTNPNFDDGHHHQDNIPEIVVPDGWYIYWIDNESFPGCGTPPAYRPESVVWHISGAPDHEKKLFFLSGEYCWKVFKANAAVYFAVTQELSGLTPGAHYRFKANVYPDIVVKYENYQKVRPGDIWSAETRVGWSAPSTPWPHAQDGDVNWDPWFNVNNKNFKFGEYNEIWMEFVAPASGEARVWLECKAKWGFENNWFMDSFILEQVGETIEEPTEPDDTPYEGKPVHARGVPRVQYQRVYLLLPPDLPAEMVEAAARVAKDIHATLGFSADDAGVGDLDERRVIGVNPHHIGSGVDQVWYDTYYPGVKFSAVMGALTSEELEARLRSLF